MIKLKKILASILLVLAIVSPISYANAGSNYLYIGGMTAGFVINTSGASVVGISDVVSNDLSGSPAKNADIRIGDKIVSINGIDISKTNCITSVLDKLSNEKALIQIERDGQTLIKNVELIKSCDGKYKLGVFVRETLNGIGTITYITEDMNFGALGHAIMDEHQKVLSITAGSVYNCSVVGVVKGKRGRAGELRGVFVEDKELGEISYNNEKGIFGKIKDKDILKSCEKVEIGKPEMGNAIVRTCVDGIKTKDYKINIVKTDEKNSQNKNLVIKITDRTLLDYTNGILQGMSGSPIVQNGKIVGAVTHVFINDPTRGYGISIENMMKN